MTCKRENEILLFLDNKSQLDLGKMGSGHSLGYIPELKTGFN